MKDKYVQQVSGVALHAGFPNPAIDQFLENPDFNRLLIKHPASTFCMRLRGSEWEAAGIFDGDILVIDRALDPKKTDLVVWWDRDNFAVSHLNKLPKKVEQWGTVTNVIHQFRK